MLYVLVCETGEYSSSDYELMGYFRTEEDALKAHEYYESREKFESELAEIQRKYRTIKQYFVREVYEGIIPCNIDINTELEKRKMKLENAKRISAEKKKQEQIEKQIEDECKQQECKMQIHEFLDWWYSGDEYFVNKKEAKIRAIKPMILRYMASFPKDDRVTEWFHMNKMTLYTSTFI